MPRLEMELLGLPIGMYQGEVAVCTAVLRNRGTLPLRNLQLVLSSPEVSGEWGQGALGREIAGALEGRMRGGG